MCKVNTKSILQVFATSLFCLFGFLESAEASKLLDQDGKNPIVSDVTNPAGSNLTIPAGSGSISPSTGSVSSTSPAPANPAPDASITPKNPNVIIPVGPDSTNPAGPNGMNPSTGSVSSTRPSPKNPAPDASIPPKNPDVTNPVGSDSTNLAGSGVMSPPAGPNLTIPTGSDGMSPPVDPNLTISTSSVSSTSSAPTNPAPTAPTWPGFKIISAKGATVGDVWRYRYTIKNPAQMGIDLSEIYSAFNYLSSKKHDDDVLIFSCEKLDAISLDAINEFRATDSGIMPKSVGGVVESNYLLLYQSVKSTLDPSNSIENLKVLVQKIGMTQSEVLGWWTTQFFNNCVVLEDQELKKAIPAFVCSMVEPGKENVFGSEEKEGGGFKLVIEIDFKGTYPPNIALSHESGHFMAYLISGQITKERILTRQTGIDEDLQLNLFHEYTIDGITCFLNEDWSLLFELKSIQYILRTNSLPKDKAVLVLQTEWNLFDFHLKDLILKNRAQAASNFILSHSLDTKISDCFDAPSVKDNCLLLVPEPFQKELLIGLFLSLKGSMSYDYELSLLIAGLFLKDGPIDIDWLHSQIGREIDEQDLQLGLSNIFSLRQEVIGKIAALNIELGL